MTSKPGGRLAVPLAVDANILLSIAAGRAASKALLRSFPVEIRLVSTFSVITEVREYLPIVAENTGLDPVRMQAAFETLTLEVHRVQDYHAKLEEARRRIGGRDPDDVELLALALTLRIPIWTNDKDFANARVTLCSTAQLLARYGVFGR